MPLPNQRGPARAPTPLCSEQTLDIVTGPQGTVIPLSNLICLSLSLSSNSVFQSPVCSVLPPPCPCALLRKSFRCELLLCLLPLSIHDTSKVSPSAYPQGRAFLWLMVYVFHSSLKHKRLISLPCGGQQKGERVWERGKLLSKRMAFISPSCLPFCAGCHWCAV